MIVDHRAQLAHDRLGDLPDVVQPVQLGRERAQQLDLGQRLQLLLAAGGAAGVPLRPYGRGVAGGAVLAPILGDVQRGVGRGQQLGRVLGVVGKRRDAAGHGQRARAWKLAHPRAQAVGRRLRSALVGLGHQDRELLTAHAEGRVGGPQHRARRRRHPPQHQVALHVAMHVVQQLEVIQVERDQRHRPLVAVRPLQLGAHPLLVDAVVEESRQPVRLRLTRQLLADLGVVQGQRRQVGEVADQLELVVAEGDTLAQAVDVEHADRLVAHHQRHGRDRLRLVLGAGHQHDARIEVRRRHVLGEALLHHPTGQALAQRQGRVEDLGGVQVDGVQRHQQAAHRIDPVDGQHVVGHQPLQLIGDAVEQLVQAGGSQQHPRHLQQRSVRGQARALGVLGRTGTCEQVILSKQMGGAGHRERTCHSQFPAWGVRLLPPFE